MVRPHHVSGYDLHKALSDRNRPSSGLYPINRSGPILVSGDPSGVAGLPSGSAISSWTRPTLHTSGDVMTAPSRSDTPVMRPSAQAVPLKVIGLPSSPDEAAKAIKQFEEDTYARSTVSSRTSLLATWLKVLRQWFGDRPALPLTPCSVNRVLCAFKYAGYRTAENYGSREKAEHISLGFKWTSHIESAMKLGLQSCRRGICPSKQAASFNLRDVMSIKLAEPGQDRDSPVGVVNMAIVGSMFMLREIEIANDCWSHVFFGDVECTISLCLPVTKN